MSIVIDDIEEREPVRRLFTAADLAALPSELPTGTVDYELWEGELRPVAPPSDEHSGAGASVIGALLVLGQWKGLGLARDDVGVVLSREPDTVVSPDAAFLTTDQLPPKRSREGYLETIPALLVEIRSRNNTWKSIEEKVRGYLAAGARVVWVLDPKRKRVLVYRPGTAVEELNQEATLTAEGIIEGFEFPVHRLFEGV